jgi:hypothetical protein
MEPAKIADPIKASRLKTNKTGTYQLTINKWTLYQKDHDESRKLINKITG